MIGVDLISIKKFRKIKRSDYGHWERVFSSKEWAYAFGDASSAEHLAGMFAVKEAAMKATGAVGVKNYRKFEVSHAKNGAPKLNLSKSKVSISHDRNYAVAVVLVC